MKKALYLFAAASLMVACDPIEEGGSFSPTAVTDSQLSQQGFFSFVQKDADGNLASDGNYFTYTTNPATIVRVYNYNAKGEEQQLAIGSSGSFPILPTRGSDPNQKFYVQVVNSDLSKAQAEYTATVYVKQELTLAEKLMVSNSGKKTWIWDTTVDQCWGNAGYGGFATGGAASLTGGQWWGVGPADLGEQITNYGYAYNDAGDADEEAFMVFNEDGSITKSSTSDAGSWAADLANTSDLGGYGEGTTMGRFTTTGSGILFNQRINAGDHGDLPATISEFDIAYVSPEHLVLIAPSYFKASGGESWQEGTFWRFRSTTDIEGCLTNNDSKTWKWDTTVDQCWGNAGYSGFATGGAGSLTGGQWWGVGPADLTDQIANYGYSFQDAGDATMTFKNDGTYTKTSGGKGTWTFDANNTTDLGGYNEGKTFGRLMTEGDGILFNQRINAGDHGDLPTTISEFDIAFLGDDHLVLIAPSYFKASGGESWMEGTFWRFIPAE